MLTSNLRKKTQMMMRRTNNFEKMSLARRKKQLISI